MATYLNGAPAVSSLTVSGRDAIQLVGDATTWNDIRVAASATKLGGSKDPDFIKVLDNGSGSQGVFGLAFSASTEEEAYFAMQIPHNWKLGSNIDAHIHWMPTVNSGAGEHVSWGLEFTVQKITGVFGNTTIEYGDTPFNNPASLIANTHYLTEITEIDMSAIDGVSSMLIGRVFRDATGAGGTDNYGADAILLEIDFHYEIDGFGSRDEYIK